VPKPRDNLAGRKFGMLLVIDFKESLNRAQYWNCLCACGVKKIIQASHLKAGSTLSCGCHRIKRLVTHNNSKSVEYKAWVAMRDRCYNENNESFQYYGKRAITVCERWLSSFENFLADMGKRPKFTSLDRLDVNGNYCKENCQWSNVYEQAYNKRTYASNKSGVCGVFWCDRDLVWIPSISKNSRKFILGRCEQFEEAVTLRKEAEILHYGGLKYEQL
jgi:hypothetical protein